MMILCILYILDTTKEWKEQQELMMRLQGTELRSKLLELELHILRLVEDMRFRE